MSDPEQDDQPADFRRCAERDAERDKQWRDQIKSMEIAKEIAATAAVVRRGCETMAAKLLAAGWTVTEPGEDAQDADKDAAVFLSTSEIIDLFRKAGFHVK